MASKSIAPTYERLFAGKLNGIVSSFPEAQKGEALIIARSLLKHCSDTAKIECYDVGHPSKVIVDSNSYKTTFIKYAEQIQTFVDSFQITERLTALKLLAGRRRVIGNSKFGLKLMVGGFNGVNMEDLKRILLEIPLHGLDPRLPKLISAHVDHVMVNLAHRRETGQYIPDPRSRLLRREQFFQFREED